MSQIATASPSPGPLANPALKITPGRTLARNSLLNLATTGWNLALIILVMPRLVHRLGTDSYGVFALAWALIGYLSVFDIGVSQAAVKFIAQGLAKQDFGFARSVFRGSLLLNLLLGSIGGIALFLVTPMLINRAFQVPPAIRPQARIVFYAVAAALPGLIALGTLRSTLAAAQRFGWINSVNAVASTLIWSLAWVMANRGVQVVPIAIMVLAVRTATIFVYAAVIQHLMPNILGLGAARHVIVELLTFGGWVTIWQVFSPLLFYIDRFLIASMVSLTAVTYYSVPFEGVTRMSVLPASLAATLFPAFSERSLHEERGPLHALFWRTMKYLLAAMVPCVLLLLLFGRDALMFWMGPDFAAKVTVVMGILAIGTLLNGLGYFPSIALQSIGRPDVTAKLLMVETPIYLAMCYFLIPRFGIAGAAAAYSLRSTLDTVLLLFCSWKLMNLNFESARQSGLGRILVLTLMAAAASPVLYRLGGSFAMRLVGALTMITAYAASIWYFAFLPAERSLLLNVVRVSKR